MFSSLAPARRPKRCADREPRQGDPTPPPSKKTKPSAKPEIEYFFFFHTRNESSDRTALGSLASKPNESPSEHSRPIQASWEYFLEYFSLEPEDPQRLNLRILLPDGDVRRLETKRQWVSVMLEISNYPPRATTNGTAELDIAPNELLEVARAFRRARVPRQNRLSPYTDAVQSHERLKETCHGQTLFTVTDGKGYRPLYATTDADVREGEGDKMVQAGRHGKGGNTHEFGVVLRRLPGATDYYRLVGKCRVRPFHSHDCDLPEAERYLII